MAHSLQIITLARQDYAERLKPVAAICAEYEMSPDRLYFYVDGGAPSGTFHFPPLPRRRDGAVKPRARQRLRGGRTEVVRRLWRTAEAQVREIEARLTRNELAPAERERDARMLAVLVKTLRELTALDDQQAADKSAAAAAGDDADAITRDMDEFRRALARRMDAFVDARLGGGVPGDREAG